MSSRKGIPLGALDPEELIGIQELAGHSKCTVTAIYCARHKAPWKFPPPATPPGVRPILWRVGTVLAHRLGEEEKNRLEQEAKIIQMMAAKAPPKKPGRPTKAESIRRRQAALEVA